MPAPAPRAARAVLLGGLVLAATATPRPARLAPLPGPFPAIAGRAPIDAVAENARCEGCHADVAAEQRASLHGASNTAPPYARAFAQEPLPFCQGCHAPEADANAPVPEALGAMGVGCVTCHLTGDAVLAAPAVGPARSAPHRVERDARFGGAGACAACHEFAFPELGLRRPFGLMQSTVTEHRGSPYASFACAGCHMPRVDGPRGPHRSHAFLASRSPDVVRKAAAVRAERSSATSIRITLTAGEVGHAFPTGDLFRRLTASAETAGAAGDPRATRHLMRRFGEHRVGLAGRRVQVGDDRVGVDGPERVVDLDLGPGAAGLPIRFRVDYERVEHPLSSDGEQALIEGAIPLAEGVVPPDPAAEGER
jgi:hypothetical protein